MIIKGSRIRVTQSEGSTLNAKELQGLECMAKVIQTLFKDIQNDSKIPK